MRPVDGGADRRWSKGALDDGFRAVPKPNVSVIVCAYTLNRWDSLVAAIRSLREQTYAPDEIIVVIDHNYELLARAFIDLGSHADVVENAGQPGLSDARNTGLAMATSDIVAFLDDDAAAEPDWLEMLLEPYSDEHVLAVGGRIDPIWEGEPPSWMPEEFFWVIGCTYRGMPEGTSAVRNVIGANMSFRRKLLEDVGGFPAELGRTADNPLGDEETEACIRVRRLRPDGVVLFEPKARVGHRVPASRGEWKYFRDRCRGEGISKARLVGALGQREGLSSERSYSTRTLPAGVIRNLGSALSGRDLAGFARAGAIVGGLAVTATAFAAEALRRKVAFAQPRLAPREFESGGGPAFIAPVPAELVPDSALPGPGLPSSGPSSPAPPGSAPPGSAPLPSFPPEAALHAVPEPKLRVLMVTPRFLPLTGGVENHVDQVARRLADKADVCVLTTDRTKELPAEEVRDGVRILRVPAWPRNRDYYFAPRLSRIIGEGDWDMVHVQSYHTAVAPLAMLAAKRAHIPYVLTFHGGGHSSQLRNALRGTQWSLLRPLLARARKLICVARFEAEFFSERLDIPPDRFAIVANGSDLPSPSRTVGLEVGALASEERPTIVSLGRLERYKGHHRVIEALPEILQAEPDAELLVLGTGPYRDELAQLAEQLGVSQRVRIESIPADDRQRMADTLAEASLVTLMSEFETHPLAVIEAVSLRRPALVADTSGLRELAEQGLARAIPLASSAHDIAEAAVEELRNPHVVPAVDLPTWDDCADGVLSVYHEVLESPRQASRHRREPRRASSAHAKTASATTGAGSWVSLGLTALFTALGILAIALSYSMARQSESWAEAVYWGGLLLAFAPVSLRLTRAEVSRAEALGILVLTGIALYAVVVLQSPTMFTGYDEIMHYRTLDDIVQSQHLFARNPLLAISPYYPGLELVTHAVVMLTGLSGFAAGLLVVGVSRVLAILALYLLLAHVSNSERLAALGTMLYMTAPSFIFFDGQYAYESLALPLAILCLFLLHRAQREQGVLRTALNLLAGLIVLAVIATHHVTSYILVITLVAWDLTARIVRRRRGEGTLPGSGWMAVFALSASAIWFFGVATMTVDYLAPHITGAVQEFWRIVSRESASRRLFESTTGQSAALLERIVGIGAVALIVAIIPVGFLYARRHIRRDVFASLLIVTAIAYPAAMLLRFTSSGWQVGSRALAFIYVGLALVLAAGFVALSVGKRRVPWYLQAAVVLVIFAGGVIAGISPDSRLPRPYSPAAGSASIDAETISAAVWARDVLGPSHRFAADYMNGIVLASYGRQWMISVDDGVSVSGLFLTPTFGNYQASIIRKADVQYALVDRRIAGVVPSQGFFYEKWEKQVADYGSTVSTETLSLFDSVAGASRVYDSGDIEIYYIGGLGQ